MQRRSFLAGATGAAFATALSQTLLAAQAEQSPTGRPKLPLLDLHVHLDNSTIEKVAALSAEQGVKYGIVEHAGTKENVYPVVLSNDRELNAYLDQLEGKPVFRGIQAEWSDWMSCFSRETLARLDYTLTDAMTFPGKDGKRVKLWEKDAAERVDMSNPEQFMNRYVDWHVEILSRQPVDILANTSWLPRPLVDQYDTLWTAKRVRRVAEAAVKYGVALEISSGMKLPKIPFLQVAKEAGVKFSFGSNGRYPNMGNIDYSLQLAAELGLTKADLFTPGMEQQKAVRRRSW
jgi:histidinol phosphatase-like PHP family hydrolase